MADSEPTRNESTRQQMSPEEREIIHSSQKVANLGSPTAKRSAILVDSGGSDPKERVLFIGNVCVDICMYVDDYPKEDSKSRTNEVVTRRGGNASTSAIVASYLGTPNVSFVGTLGPDSSIGVIVNDFDKAGIDYTYCLRDSAPQSTSYIFLSRESGSRTIIHHPSTPYMKATQFPVPPPATPCCWAHFEGRNHEERGKMMSMLTQCNIPISVEIEKIGRDGDIEFFINKIGISLIFISKDYVKDRNYDSAEAFFEFCKKERNSNLIHSLTIVIPWGERGAYGCEINSIDKKREMVVFSEAASVNQVKETLGAGDTFNGAFLHAFIQKKDLQKSLDFANLVAGHKVQYHGFECVKDVSHKL